MKEKNTVESNEQGVNRRDFVKAGIAGAAALGLSSVATLTPPGDVMAGAKGEFKQEAKKTWKGLETCTVPSFTPDHATMDEEGIRWDVQQAIRQGFFSTLAAGVGLSHEEKKKFVEIIAHEGKGKILVSCTVVANTMEQNIDLINHAKKVGCNHLMLAYPSTFMPKSEDEIFDYTKKICATSKLPIYIYSTHKIGLERFHPSGLSPALLSRIADIENVVALKIGSGDFTYITECFERCGDRIMVNSASVGAAPMLIRGFGQQWIGAAVYELYQSPEKPYLVTGFNHLLAGEVEQGMDLFNKIGPLVGIFQSQMMPMIMLGAYHWSLLKYYQWCTGSNGGFTRHPLRMHKREMMQVKFALQSVGITPRHPDEEFFVGRSVFAKH